MDPQRDLLLARMYDLEYRDYTEDLDFYVQHALAHDPKKRLPVLELGCGTGRVALALAEAGFRVVGVDVSEGMLEVCREKADQSGLEKQATWVRADMRDLSPLEVGRFGTALCALNTFAYLVTTEDQIAALTGVRQRLIPGGKLMLDLTPPLPSLLPPGDGEMLHQGSYIDSDRALVHKMLSGKIRPATQTHDVTLFYDRETPDGALSRISQSLVFKWTGRYEMELLLQVAGYTMEGLYGSYELDDFEDESSRMIFVTKS